MLINIKENFSYSVPSCVSSWTQYWYSDITFPIIIEIYMVATLFTFRRGTNKLYLISKIVWKNNLEFMNYIEIERNIGNYINQ